MILFARFKTILFSFFLSSSLQSVEDFKVVIYNVENLFDTDGISLYDDYKPDAYGEIELANKLNKITEVLQKISGQNGPEILLLQEIEVDRSPETAKSAASLLLEKLHAQGLGPYHIAFGYDRNSDPETWPAVQCLTLSKYPIKETRLHSLYRARPILETTIMVNDIPFTLFNNHWKSGASSPEMEKIRIQNAKVLRERLDKLLKDNPFRDFLVGGDLNSHYNQSTVYQKEMRISGINDVLLSAGNEPTDLLPDSKLYNLWHELPAEQRGSDAWKGKWGTLMHILLPVGLFDDRGVRYVGDSFQVAKFNLLNMMPAGQLPFKWSNDLNGFGASDHFPVSAEFRISGPKTKRGKNDSFIEKQSRQVDYQKASSLARSWNSKSLSPENYGSVFRVKGRITETRPLTLEVGGHRLGLYSFQKEVQKELFSMKRGSRVSIIGHLSRYRGQWQLIVEDRNWIN